MATVGNVLKYIIKTTSNDEILETTLSNKFSVNPSATYNDVDIASRALISLSKNNYQDTNLITDIAVNDTLFTFELEPLYNWEVGYLEARPDLGKMLISKIYFPENYIFVQGNITRLTESLNNYHSPTTKMVRGDNDEKNFLIYIFNINYPNEIENATTGYEQADFYVDLFNGYEIKRLTSSIIYDLRG